MSALTAQPARRGISTVLLVGALAYLPSLRAGFVYDDQWTIVHNSAVRSFARVPDLFSGKALVDGVPDAWRPLMVIGQMTDFALFGLRPAGHHLHSLLWHLLAVLMLWLLVRRLLDDLTIATTSAAIFALHPLVVEPVVAINYREDLMAGALLLGALALLTRLEERGSSRPSSRRILLACALLALGLLAKGSAAIAPVVYLALRLCRGPVKHWRPLLLQTAALAATVVAWAVWRWTTAGGLDPYPAQGVTPVTAAAGLLQRLPTHAEVLLKTVFQLAIPVGLSPEYVQPLRGWHSAPAIISVIVSLLLVCTAVVAQRRGLRGEAAGLALLLLGWLPTSGLAPLPNLRADRYAYLPAMGFALLLAAGLHRLRRPGLRRGLTLALIAGYAALNLAQQAVWRSELSLWQTTIRRQPSSARGWAGLARAHAGQDRLDEAESAARRAVALAPHSGDLRLILANVLARQQRWAAALQHYRDAGASGVRHPGHLHSSWGWALHLAGDQAAAEKRLRRAVALAPRLAQAHANLGRVLAARGKPEQARRALRRAIALAPERRDLHRTLAELSGSEDRR